MFQFDNRDQTYNCAHSTRLVIEFKSIHLIVAIWVKIKISIFEKAKKTEID